MEDLLIPSRSRLISEPTDQLTPSAPLVQVEREQTIVLKNQEDILKTLRSKPDAETLIKCLKWLASTRNETAFDIRQPGPQAAQIINVLVNDIVTDYWHSWEGTSSSNGGKAHKLLLRCLTSVAGIGGILTRLRTLISDNEGPQKERKVDPNLSSELLDLLGDLLEGDDVLDGIWNGISQSSATPTQKQLVWKELIALLAAGRVLSVAAEVSNYQRASSSGTLESNWLVNGPLYSEWLGRSIRFMAFQNEQSPMRKKAATQLFSKSLTLGYTDQIIEATFIGVTAGETRDLVVLRQVMIGLSSHELKKVLYALIRVVSRKLHSIEGDQQYIGGLAALVEDLISDKDGLQEALVDWLTDLSGESTGSDINTRRGVLAALSSRLNILKEIVQKALEQFGDKLYIKHTPVLHQEVNAQVLLLAIGHVYNKDHSYLRSMVQSSLYIRAISNRLAAPSPRSQFLGMVVGTAVSELVDAEDKRMKFSMSEIDDDDGIWYRSLCKHNDVIGSLDDLKAGALRTGKGVAKATGKQPRAKKEPVVKQRPATESKIISIEEVTDSGDEDDDLPTYEKPDSDEEDSDEDATLVQRNKPTAPVYIRDLIAGLRDTENYDRHRLALQTAAGLIRRKATFGTEVSDHAEELATQLVGLSDIFKIDKFAELRLQGMIAVLIARPLKLGQWFSKTYFNGEYSMGQRASILTTLGMGARELAGYREEDAALTGASAAPENLFPSKKLPDKYHAIYDPNAAPVDALAKRLERAIIQPMAIEAADTLAGPNALKVRIFSSRMEVEKKRKKAIPNELAKIVAEGFFFPLTGLWRVQAQTRGAHNVFSTPFLLTHFLKTLSLILNASGASTLSLPALTTEFWSLLLSLRTTALSAPPVLEALLFSFLTLLEINSNNQRGLAEDHAKELLETQAWAEQVFEKIGGGSEEGDRVRMLAAGVLVRTREVVEKYQRLLLGDMVDFM
ncbi:telomere binding protein [Trapelia coarctata]|nr:telomere binding protein [Trapelia coarctata]